jgi:predicted lysophospholipase L1 biosynthesis ABC-type transport system permease subunit
MSSEEKRSWIYVVVGVGVAAVYFVTVLSKVPGADVTRIAYVRPMLIAIGAGIGLNIVASIAAAITAAIASPKEAGRTDERDRQIHRLGEYVGFYVMSIAAIVPLALTMAQAAHFWIANTLYLAFVLAMLASAIVKIVLYRRGF